mgnify:CR=1 FL=1
MAISFKDYWDKEYVPSEKTKKLESDLSEILGRKPGDFDKDKNYAPVQSALDAYNNRGKFSYDINGDMLYQQYKDQYMTQGKQAMMDAMGQASALTGGYGNSYAATVGQQTYQGYLQGLNDKVPELYQLALDKYNQEGQDLLTRYGLEKDKYDTAYGEWQDAVSRWNTDREYAENAYNTERAYDYGMYNDAYQKAMDKLQLGVTKDADGNEVLPTASLKAPTEKMLSDAIKVFEQGGPEALEKYAMTFPEYDYKQLYGYVDSMGAQLPLGMRTFTKTKETPNGFLDWGTGVDKDDEVKDQYGNVYKIEELPEEIQMELTKLKKDETWSKETANSQKSTSAEDHRKNVQNARSKKVEERVYHGRKDKLR